MNDLKQIVLEKLGLELYSEFVNEIRWEEEAFWNPTPEPDPQFPEDDCPIPLDLLREMLEEDADLS